jgi:hypothetical protein
VSFRPQRKLAVSTIQAQNENERRIASSENAQMNFPKTKSLLSFRVFPFLFVLLSFVPVFSGLRAEGTDGKPEPFDPRTYDFGTIREGDRPSCLFRFVNSTEDSVTALSLRIPCGCAKTNDVRKPTVWIAVHADVKQAREE